MLILQFHTADRSLTHIQMHMDSYGANCIVKQEDAADDELAWILIGFVLH